MCVFVLYVRVEPGGRSKCRVGGADRKTHALCAPFLSFLTRSAELASLRAYVTDPTGRAGLAQASSTVLLNVEHASLKANFVELRLDRHVRFFLCFFPAPAPHGEEKPRQRRPPAPPTHRPTPSKP